MHTFCGWYKSGIISILHAFFDTRKTAFYSHFCMSLCSPLKCHLGPRSDFDFNLTRLGQVIEKNEDSYYKLMQTSLIFVIVKITDRVKPNISFDQVQMALDLIRVNRSEKKAKQTIGLSVDPSHEFDPYSQGKLPIEELTLPYFSYF